MSNCLTISSQSEQQITRRERGKEGGREGGREREREGEREREAKGEKGIESECGRARQTKRQ